MRTDSKFRLIAMLAAIATATSTWADPNDPNWVGLPYTTHADLQAVNSDGFATHPLSGPLKLRGVILNDSADLLDGEPNAPVFLGGQWQIFVQAVDDGDFGGTACWMGQFYGRLPWVPPTDFYTAAAWRDELDRLDHDPLSGHVFAPGDLVEIRARAPGLPFGGKANINEQHTTDPANDFDVVLIEAGAGLPTPATVPLTMLKDATDDFIFDPSRQTGCERHQGALVRINDVWFTNPGDWGPGAVMTLTDGTRTFPARLGLGVGFTDFGPPAGAFDAIGILNQEDGNDADGYRAGYELWITHYDGNGAVLPELWALPGDSNGDGFVNFRDIDFFVAAMNDNIGAWEALFAPGSPTAPFSNNDVNGDGFVNFRDVDPFVAALQQ